MLLPPNVVHVGGIHLDRTSSGKLPTVSIYTTHDLFRFDVTKIIRTGATIKGVELIVRHYSQNCHNDLKQPRGVLLAPRPLHVVTHRLNSKRIEKRPLLQSYNDVCVVSFFIF